MELGICIRQAKIGQIKYTPSKDIAKFIVLISNTSHDASDTMYKYVSPRLFRSAILLVSRLCKIATCLWSETQPLISHGDVRTTRSFVDYPENVKLCPKFLCMWNWRFNSPTQYPSSPNYFEVHYSFIALQP
jgi:hypothetical protein